MKLVLIELSDIWRVYVNPSQISAVWCSREGEGLPKFVVHVSVCEQDFTLDARYDSADEAKEAVRRLVENIEEQSCLKTFNYKDFAFADKNEQDEMIIDAGLVDDDCKDFISKQKRALEQSLKEKLSELRWATENDGTKRRWLKLVEEKGLDGLDLEFLLKAVEIEQLQQHSANR